MGETETLEVGEMLLVNHGSTGTITVLRNGECKGRLTAQALHEAAELGDGGVAEAWRDMKVEEVDDDES